MYRITQKLTNEQAQELIGAACQSATGCIKTVLWKIEESEPIRTLDSGKFQEPEGRDGAVLPLFCHEACNILVAAARPVVKRALQPA
jgi:sirohydrochlorin cobaltochelatase